MAVPDIQTIHRMLFRISVAILFLDFDDHDTAVSAAVPVQDRTTPETRYPVRPLVSMTVIFLNLYKHSAAARPAVEVFHGFSDIRVEVSAYVRVASAMDFQEIQPARRLNIRENGTGLCISSQRHCSSQHRGCCHKVP